MIFSRKIEAALQEWKAKRNRKPLILRGARLWQRQLSIYNQNTKSGTCKRLPKLQQNALQNKTVL